MEYTVRVRKSRASYTALCPDLPDCSGRGLTEADALEALRGAIAAFRASEDPAAVTVTRTVRLAESTSSRRGDGPHEPTALSPLQNPPVQMAVIAIGAITLIIVIWALFFSGPPTPR